MREGGRKEQQARKKKNKYTHLDIYYQVLISLLIKKHKINCKGKLKCLCLVK